MYKKNLLFEINLLSKKILLFEKNLLFEKDLLYKKNLPFDKIIYYFIIINVWFLRNKIWRDNI